MASGDAANERKTDFFVSYNSANKTWAEWMTWELEAAGYTTKIQAWDFGPGSNFVLEMQRAASRGSVSSRCCRRPISRRTSPRRNGQWPLPRTRPARSAS